MSYASTADTIATELRIAGRIFEETFGGFKRSGWMNLVIVVTMAAILSIFGTLFAFIIETQLFFSHIGTGFEVSVYLQNGANLSEVSDRIHRLPYVKHIELIPKQKAWEEMKKTLEVPNIENPLPDTIHVKVASQEFVDDAVAALRQINGVEKVNFAQEFLKKLKNISNVVSVVGMVIAVFLGLMTMFVISNTIHLLIEARSREIEILRMMGVGNWYIRLPFLFQGGAYGLVGALIAYIPLSVAVFYTGKFFESFHFSTSGYSLGIVSLVLILMGIIVGAGGAFNSIHKYLRI